LLSLDGSHELPVNSETHFPWQGVDGKPDTLAQAAGEWPWTYEVDLIDTCTIQRVKVTFGSGYATEFEIRVSRDRTNWQTVAHKIGHDGNPYEFEFGATPARYLQIRALKPDGENQPGVQMSVSELEVYQ